MTAMVQALEVVLAFLLVYGVGPGLYVLAERWWRRRQVHTQLADVVGWPAATSVTGGQHRRLGRLERQLAAQLLAGDIDRAAYRHAMEAVAADDGQWRPPLVPGA